MSFRNRLTSFFIVIVLAPMLAMGFLALRLISQSNEGKAIARANGAAAAAASVYTSDVAIARTDAGLLARHLTPLPKTRLLDPKLRELVKSGALTRVIVIQDGRILGSIGATNAIAPGTAEIKGHDGALLEITVSATTAPQFADQLSSDGVAVVVRSDGVTLASTTSRPLPKSIPTKLDVGGVAYAAAAVAPLAGIGAPVNVTVLSENSLSSTSGNTSQVVAVAFLAGFALLAFSFAVLASRGLSDQVGRFLAAARRLGGGDFSAPVPVEGSDEFAQLAKEFNSMSRQLEERLAQLEAERARLRESIRRGGQTFAATLDEEALLGLALGTAIDGTGASFGRLSVRDDDQAPLSQRLFEGDLHGVEPTVLAAEAGALRADSLADAAEAENLADDASRADRVFALSVPLGPWSALGRPLGLITVGRRGRPFADEDRELLRSLVGQASMAIDNTRLHEEARKLSVTDALTQLTNHGRFQEVLAAELERARRYHHPVGLILLDIDNFKQVNDTFGHPQGDLVLRRLADVLRQSTRDGDTAARYGGEELAMVLPHTDLDGCFAIAERLRAAIEQMAIPLLDGSGQLQVTVSIGVGASDIGPKEPLIAATDAALYKAKRGGKNRTVRATPLAAKAARGE
jgi:diguanylate cyclase (GGDEF)-like protein